jgi:arsenate reductase
MAETTTEIKGIGNGIADEIIYLSLMKLIPIFVFTLLLLVLDFYATAQKSSGPNRLYPILFNYARNLYPEYRNIPMERRYVLDEVAEYLIGSRQLDGKASLLIIGSNNSTRSILAEVWAVTAAYYYGISNVNIYSGGMNTADISTNALVALEEAGFIVYKTGEGKNRSYQIKYSYNIPPVIARSKKLNDSSIPSKGYGTLIICQNADANLPFLNGSNFRTSLYYFDPGGYDQAEDALDQYKVRNREIATEMFYIFYRLKNAE